ncbi:MAG: DUF3576 domain-containing protein [Rhodospirillales bacterium]|nr:DUF3576 domain-containing protein [Rhodospirillales bacterium]
MRLPSAPARATLLALLLTGVFLAGCDKLEADYPYTEGGKVVRGSSYEDVLAKRQTVFGTGGLGSFGDTKKTPQAEGGGGIGVNSFLWRASLDTLSFMPMTSADPFGGVIITDWHSTPEAPNERFKLNVYILGRALRADGVRVAVFREVLDPAAGWRTAGVSADTAIKIEDSILTRARQLRGQSVSN